MKTRTVKQTVNLSATPLTVYAALMESKQHSAFTGDKATIGTKKGIKWSAFDGYCYGIIMKLVKGKKIVETWRADDWKKDENSILTLELKKTSNGTKLVMTHGQVPTRCAQGIREGWKEYYWTPLKRYLNNKRKKST